MAYKYSNKIYTCGYKWCNKPITQSDTSGRIKQYCDAICRKAAHRMTLAENERKRIQAEQEKAFVARVAGTPGSIWPALRDFEMKYGTSCMEAALTIIRKTIKEGDNDK